MGKNKQTKKSTEIPEIPRLPRPVLNAIAACIREGLNQDNSGETPAGDVAGGDQVDESPPRKPAGGRKKRSAGAISHGPMGPR